MDKIFMVVAGDGFGLEYNVKAFSNKEEADRLVLLLEAEKEEDDFVYFYTNEFKVHEFCEEIVVDGN